jgi:hypothetical protein
MGEEVRKYQEMRLMRAPTAQFDQSAYLLSQQDQDQEQQQASASSGASAPASAPVKPPLEHFVKAKEFVPPAPEEKDMTGSMQGGRSAHKNNNKKYTRKKKSQKKMKTVRRKNNKKSTTTKRNKKSLRVYRTKSLHRRRKANS